ncbi:hypothetical protein BH24ACT3_BH24ACT3_17030 [soil metagenome]
MDPSREAILLLLHTKLRRWFQPGGHADGEANLARVAFDEATEETGIEGLALAVPAIDLDVHLVPLPGEDPHLHLDVRYLAIAPAGAQAPGNHESLDQRWVGPDGLRTLGVDDGTERLVRRGLAMARTLRR